MNKHTLGIAVIGTLASSLILRQVAQAEEVISSAEVLSPEVSEYEVDDEKHENAHDKQTLPDINSATEDTSYLNSNTDNPIPDNQELEEARQTYNELITKAQQLRVFGTFWTEESLIKLNLFNSDAPITALQFKEAIRSKQELLNSLENNFNYTGSWESLLDDNVISSAENSPEYFEFLLVQEQAQKLRANKPLTPKSADELSIGQIPPIKSVIVAYTNQLKENMEQIEESSEIAELMRLREIAEKKLNSNNYGVYTHDSIINLRTALNESFIEHTEDDNFTDSGIEFFSAANKKLKSALEQLTEIPGKREYIAALTHAQQLLDEKKWTPDSYHNLQNYIIKTNSLDESNVNYNNITANLKSLTDALIYSPEQEELSKALKIAREKFYSNVWTKESASALNSIISSSNIPDVNPSAKLAELRLAVDSLVPDMTFVLNADKTIIDAEVDKELTITATTERDFEGKDIFLAIVPHRSYPGVLIADRDYPHSISSPRPIHRESKKIIFKIPILPQMQHEKKLEFVLYSKNSDNHLDYDRLSTLSMDIANTTFGKIINTIESTSLNKHEVSIGESLQYDVTFTRVAMPHKDTFNIYRVGETTPFKTITLITKKPLATQIYGSYSSTRDFNKNSFSYFTIDDSYTEGEYEIRDGHWEDLPVALQEYALLPYTIPKKFYQRFTVKKKVTDTDNTTNTPRQFADATTNVAVVLSDKAPKSIMKMQVVDVDEAELAKQSEWLKSVDADLFVITFVDKDGNKVVGSQ